MVALLFSAFSSLIAGENGFVFESDKGIPSVEWFKQQWTNIDPEKDSNFPVVSTDKIGDRKVRREDVLKYSARTLESVSQLLIEALESDPSKIVSWIPKLLHVRNSLLLKGGFANSAIAGSVSEILNFCAVEVLYNGGKNLPNVFDLHANTVLVCINKSLVLEGKSPIDYEGQGDNSRPSSHVFRAVLKTLGGRFEPDAANSLIEWIKVGKNESLNFSFDSNAATRITPISHLVAWAKILDQAYMIAVVNAAIRRDLAFLDFKFETDYKQIRSSLSKVLETMPKEYSCLHQFVITHRYVYEVLREFRMKHGGQESQFPARLLAISRQYQ